MYLWLWEGCPFPFKSFLKRGRIRFLKGAFLLCVALNSGFWWGIERYLEYYHIGIKIFLSDFQRIVSLWCILLAKVFGGMKICLYLCNRKREGGLVASSVELLFFSGVSQLLREIRCLSVFERSFFALNFAVVLMLTKYSLSWIWWNEKLFLPLQSIHLRGGFRMEVLERVHRHILRQGHHIYYGDTNK